MKKLWTAYQNLFRAPTLEEIMEHEAKKAQQEAQQSANVIRHHQYQRHMANARLDAIQAWRTNNP